MSLAVLLLTACAAGRPSTADRVPAVDCSDFAGEGTAGRVGEVDIVPGPGRSIRAPEELAGGVVRVLWQAQVPGGTIEWVSSAGPDRTVLWLLRVFEGRRCVLGTYAGPDDGRGRAEMVDRRLTPDGREEIVLMRFQREGRVGWNVLVADATNLWDGLGGNRSPWLFLAERAEFRERDGRLLLVLINGEKGSLYYFNGVQFSSRP